MKKLKELFFKYKEIITYLIFGGLTTLLSYGVFILFTEVIKIAETTLWANIISNAAGIIFAYCTNRKWVFESKERGFVPVLKEFGKFVGARLFTVLFDLAFVYVAVDKLGGNNYLWKFVSIVIVVILNYVISKFMVFTKKRKDKEKDKEENKEEVNVDNSIILNAENEIKEKNDEEKEKK